MLIDTHAHVNFKLFKDDGDDVIRRALDADTWVINVGSQSTTSKRAVEYAEKYEQGVYAIVGLHPVHVAGDITEEVEIEGKDLSFKTRKEEFDYEYYKELALHPKTVGIGECGLDYYRWDDEHVDTANARERQMEALHRHIDLAAELNLPLMMHTRAAMPDMVAVIRERADDIIRIGAVMHCFQGDKKDASFCIEHNVRLGFNGLITFAHDWDEIIKWAPLESLVVETDCPYLTPVPFRGKRNEPLYVRYAAQRIADIRGMTLDEVADATTQNARALFTKLGE